MIARPDCRHGNGHWIARKHPRLIFLVLIFGFEALFLLGNWSTPLWDRDEPRYAQCSRQMLQSGDWVVPWFLDKWRPHKPPLIYWCQATAMWLLGDTGGAARLPSALAMSVSTSLLGIFVWRSAGSRRALWTTFVFGSSALVIAAAKFCITDAVLLLWILIGQGALYVIWKGHMQGARVGWAAPGLFWVSTGLAGLTKGPVALAMHTALVIVLISLDVGSDWRSLRAWKHAAKWLNWTCPVFGVLVLAALGAPWLIMVHLRAPGFLSMLFHRAGSYATRGDEGHARPPGFYLLLIWGLLFPWSLLLPTAIGMGIRCRNRPLLRFSLAAAIGPWLVMELLTNKLPFYILPSFPGLAVLIAHAIVRGSCAPVGHRDDDFKRNSFRMGVLGWGLATAILGALPWLCPGWIGPLPTAATATLSVIAFLYLALVTTFFFRHCVFNACLTLGLGMCALMAVLCGLVLPDLSSLQGSLKLGRDLNALGAGGDTPVAMIGYREPSLAFYQGGGAREREDGYLASDNFAERWIVLNQEAWLHVPDRQRRFEVMTSPEQAWQYSDGRGRTDVYIVRKR